MKEKSDNKRFPGLPGMTGEVEDLTKAQARAFHEDTAYNHYRLDQIKDHDVAHHLFDMLINTDPTAVRDIAYGAIDQVMRE
ncbi:MAG: glycosyl hydrolase 108 family protein [Pseudomonadota bacterium]